MRPSSTPRWINYEHGRIMLQHKGPVLCKEFNEERRIDGENEKARQELEKALSLDKSFDGADEAEKVLAGL